MQDVDARKISFARARSPGPDTGRCTGLIGDLLQSGDYPHVYLCDRFRAFVKDHLASARLIGWQKRSQIIREMIRRSVRCSVFRLFSRTIHRAVQVRSWY